MILYGASGHGKVIIEILELLGDQNIIIWDDALKSDVWHYPVSKPDLQFAGLEKLIISIGYNNIRKAIAERLIGKFLFGNAIHPQTNISKRVKLGAGTVVMAGVSINADVVIGKHCIINTNASIDHDCLIANYCHVSPNVTLCGNVTVDVGTHIGAGATVIPGISIGKWCTIGAGTTVIKDVPDFATVVGVAGRIIKMKKSND
ncbi:MAG: acetyltransferase [Flavipsychrobacter sp.]|nr:acetyltransferase [Flavipsychrobacter sp.]